jgi:ribosomal protein S12 methylthiotransferase accessory factor
MVHADYSVPVKPGQGLFPASTNGLASGNHMAEALCNAMCEVIERDAVAVWHHRPLSRRSQTRLRLSSVDNPACRSACEVIAKAGLDLSAWDVTSDLGVPAFLCLIHGARQDDEHIGLGSSAHPDKAAALLRALIEAAQTRLTYISGSRDDLDPEEFTATGRIQKRRLAHGLLRAGPPACDYAALPSLGNKTFRDDLEWLIERLISCGIEEVVAVDLSKEAVAIPVVRVVIPGLEAPHDDVQYAPGPRARAAAAEPER